MRERELEQVLGECWKGKDSSEEAQEAIVSKWDGHTYLLRLVGSTTLEGKSKRSGKKKDQQTRAKKVVLQHQRQV